MDLRPLCEFSGLDAFAVDTEGKHHKLDASQLVSGHPYSFPGPADNAVISGFESVVLRPKESLSWPVRIHPPPNDSPRPESLPLPYKIDHFQCVLSLKALAKHTGGRIGRQFQETIARAKSDPDSEVAKTAIKLFGWVKDGEPR